MNDFQYRELNSGLLTCWAGSVPLAGSLARDDLWRRACLLGSGEQS